MNPMPIRADHSALGNMPPTGGKPPLQVPKRRRAKNYEPSSWQEYFDKQIDMPNVPLKILILGDSDFLY